jgi:hypothetical protein
VFSFTTSPLYPQGKIPWYPLDRRLVEPHSWCGHGSEDKNSQPLPGLEPPIIKRVAQRSTTELSWFICSLVTAVKHEIQEIVRLGSETVISYFTKTLKF